MPGPPVAHWTDLVVGVDLHDVLVPTPAGPAPAKLPHPYVGMAGDPVGDAVAAATAPLISLCLGQPPAAPGVVLVNGVPKMTTNESSRNVPLLPHIPMPPGTAFVKPPSGNGAHHVGSLTVTAGGGNVVRLGEVVATCADPLPLPTSTVVTLPRATPVLVGGPPGMNPLQAAQAHALGRLFRTTWRAASAALKFAGRYTATRLRTWLPKARCFFTGHPVDVATGAVITDAVDFELPGSLPLVLERSYCSAWASRPGPVGWGWAHSLDSALWFEPDGVVVRLGDGREVVFDTSDQPKGVLPVKGELRDLFTGFTLLRIDARRWRLIHPDGRVDEFAPIPDDAASSAAITGLCRIVKTTRRCGDPRIEYLYVAGRLAAVRDGGGRIVKLQYDDKGRLACVQLPRPDEPDLWVDHVTYRYSETGDLIEVRDALGNSTRYAYAAHLMVKEIRRNGVTFFWVYDGRSSRARCVRTWGRNADELMFNQKIHYNPRARRTVVVDSYGNATEYTANELNLVVQIRNAEGKATRFEYDDYLRLVAETDPLGHVSRTSYDRTGQPSTTTAPDGARTIQKWDRRFPELQTLFCDENGGVWRRDYDDQGRLRQIRGPDPSVRRDLAWSDGLVAAVEAPGGRRTDFRYDRRRNLVAVRAPNGAETRYEYDERGRLTRVIRPSGARTEIAYDLLDRPVQVRWPDGDLAELTYDPEGNLLEERTRLSRVRLKYANFDRVASREEAGLVTETYVWGQEGELREVRNALDQPYRYEYDRLLQVTREIGFDLQPITYKRDAAGRVIRRQTPGGHTEIAHDAAGRVVKRAHADGTWEKYAYRADGQMVSAENQTIAVKLERDALGRVVCDRQGDEWVRTTYALGEVVQVDSSRGARMTIFRDVLGNPESIRLGAPGDATAELRYSYDAEGLEIGRELPGGARLEILRDPMGRPTHQTVRANGGGWSRAYTWHYDRLTQIRDTHLGETTFHYDERGLPVIAEYNGERQIRAQDAVGNVYRTLDCSDRTYAPGGRLVETKEERFEYTADGQLAARTATDGRRWEYRWDGAGMLVAVVRPDGSEIAYGYDALGRRVWKRLASVETSWVWTRNTPLHEAANVTSYHEPGAFTPIARVANRELEHVVADHLGTPAAAVSTAGELAWQMQSDLYGTPRVTPDAVVAERRPSRWPGHWYDRDADLFYARFRYYSGAMGGFISKDPLSLDGGLSPYAYVSNPLTAVDPLGLEEEIVVPSIREALAQAADFAKVPRIGRGGEKIPLSRLDQASQGANYQRFLKIPGWQVRGLGRKHVSRGRTIAEFFLHPDGHPHMLGPEHPDHHHHPHVNAFNAQGEKRAYVVKPGGCGT